MAASMTQEAHTAQASDFAKLHEMGLYLVKSMDAMKRQIAQIEPTANGGIVTYKDGRTANVNVASIFSSALLCDGFVIVGNTRQNVDNVIAAWDAALKFPALTIIFLDPSTGNKWLLRPAIHVKVAEPRTLAQGIITLYDHSLL